MLLMLLLYDTTKDIYSIIIITLMCVEYQTHESSGCGVRSTKPTAGLLVLMKGLLSFTP